MLLTSDIESGESDINRLFAIAIKWHENNEVASDDQVIGQCVKSIDTLNRTPGWQLWMDTLLGTKLDRDIADDLAEQGYKFSQYVVYRRRSALGIEPFCHFKWTPEFDALLGTQSDRSLAKTLSKTVGKSVNAGSVTVRRAKLGIPPFEKVK